MSAGGPPRTRYASFPIRIRELEVVGTSRVTPGVTRVTLGGPGIAGFESHTPDEHVKLVFPDPDTGVTRAPVEDGDHLDWPVPFPPARDYTIRRYDREAGTVDIDVVLHEGGLGSAWAESAGPGDRIWVAGPRPGKNVPLEFGFWVLLGDETGLPAIARRLEELPRDAAGVAAIEVAGPPEEQPIDAPEGVTVTWIHRDGPPGPSDLLAGFARTIALPDGVHTYVFAAGEAGSMKLVRAWARAHGIGREQSDIVGYWRRGVRQGDPPGLVDRVRHRVQHLLGVEH